MTIGGPQRRYVSYALDTGVGPTLTAVPLRCYVRSEQSTPSSASAVEGETEVAYEAPLWLSDETAERFFDGDRVFVMLEERLHRAAAALQRCIACRHVRAEHAYGELDSADTFCNVCTKCLHFVTPPGKP